LIHYGYKDTELNYEFDVTLTSLIPKIVN